MPGLRLSGREWAALGAIAAAALVWRLVWMRFETAIEPDGYYYAVLGQRLVEGDFRGGLSLYWPPFYPLLVGISTWVFGDLEVAGRMVSVVLGSLLVVPEYLLIRGMSARRPAYVGAILVAFYPALLNGSTQLLSDVPFTFFFVAALVAGMQAVFGGSRRMFLPAGLLLGASYLTRPEAFAFLPLFLVLVLLVAPALPRDAGRQRRWVPLLLTIIGFGILAVPYLAFLRVESGRWTISAKLEAHLLSGGVDWRRMKGDGMTHADEYYADLRPASGAAPAPKAAAPPRTGPTRSRATRMIDGLFSQYLEVVPRVFPPLVLVLAGVGMFAGERTRKRALQEAFLFCFAASALIGYGIVLSSPRYLIPVVPLVLYWVAQGIVEAAHRLQAVLPRIAGMGVAAIALLVLVLGASMAKEVTYPLRAGMWRNPYEMKVAGLWIKQHVSHPPLLIANSPVVAFYAGAAHCYYLPDAPLDVVVEHARRLRVDYLVVDERKVRERVMQPLEALLHDASGHPGLRMVFEDDQGPRAKVRVFELVEGTGGAAGEEEDGDESPGSS